MGRLRANFARLGNPMQDCHLRKEPNAACGGSGGRHLKYRRPPLMIKPNNRTLGAKGKTSKPGFARWKCTPFGAVHHLSPGGGTFLSAIQ